MECDSDIECTPGLVPPGVEIADGSASEIEGVPGIRAHCPAAAPAPDQSELSGIEGDVGIRRSQFLDCHVVDKIFVDESLPLPLRRRVGRPRQFAGVGSAGQSDMRIRDACSVRGGHYVVEASSLICVSTMFRLAVVSPSQSWEAVPCGQLSAYLFVPSVRGLVDRILRCMPPSAHSSAQGTFAKRLATIKALDLSNDYGFSDNDETKRCCMAGRRLCSSGPDPLLDKIKTSFRIFMGKICPSKTRERMVLQASDLVLRVSSVKAVFWLHLSYMDLRPARLIMGVTFHPHSVVIMNDEDLQLRDDAVGDRCRPHSSEVCQARRCAQSATASRF